MIDNDLLHRLSAQAAALLPAANEARHKAEQELFGLLKGALGPLDLVSREEFQAQMNLLARAEAQLVELEQRLAQLEQSRPVPAPKPEPAE